LGFTDQVKAYCCGANDFAYHYCQDGCEALIREWYMCTLAEKVEEKYGLSGCSYESECDYMSHDKFKKECKNRGSDGASTTAASGALVAGLAFLAC